MRRETLEEILVVVRAVRGRAETYAKFRDLSPDDVGILQRIEGEIVAELEITAELITAVKETLGGGPPCQGVTSGEEA